jgi:hypothetical protein
LNDGGRRHGKRENDGGTDLSMEKLALFVVSFVCKEHAVTPKISSVIVGSNIAMENIATRTWRYILFMLCFLLPFPGFVLILIGLMRLKRVRTLARFNVSERENPELQSKIHLGDLLSKLQ